MKIDRDLAERLARQPIRATLLYGLADDVREKITAFSDLVESGLYEAFPTTAESEEHQLVMVEAVLVDLEALRLAVRDLAEHWSAEPSSAPVRDALKLLESSLETGRWVLRSSLDDTESGT